MKTNLKAIIIDDEENARDNLQHLIQRHCKAITVIAEAHKVDIAVEKIKQFQPDIVFLDIEMPQKNGFELFKNFEKLNFHVVFVTAYNHYAIKAFEVSAVDYLLKPIDVQRLKEAEEKLVKQTQLNPNFQVLKNNLETPEPKHITIPYKTDSAVVKINDIVYIQANRAYSKILVFNTDKQIETAYTYAKKLVYFEENLPKKLFIRVHRSWVINFNFITSYSRKSNLITLKNMQQIPVSKSYKEDFEKYFI